MKRRLLVALALVGLLSVMPLSQAGAATQTTSDVTLLGDPSVVVGSSTLTRTASSISFSLQTSGLTPGHAVTVWWMVVNPDGGVAVLYAAGHVIDQDGTAEFGGSLKVGDAKGSVMGDDSGLEDAAAATVMLVVRDHGPAKPGDGQPTDPHLRRLQPDLHRPAAVGALDQLRQAPATCMTTGGLTQAPDVIGDARDRRSAVSRVPWGR
jgi:hypothetical protein